MDLSDAVYVLNHLFVGGAESPCRASADADANESLDITDPIRILNYLFTGGQALPAPFEECGPGSGSDEALGCLSFPPCG